MGGLKNSVGLNDEHLKAIGLVAVNWGFIENILSSIIWSISNLRQPRGIAITAHLSERSRKDICNALAHETFRGHPEEEELSGHLKYIFNDLYPKRNKLIHGSWGYSSTPDATDLFPISARGKVKIGPKESMTAEDILKIADEIEGAAIKLEAIRRKIIKLLPTLTGWP